MNKLILFIFFMFHSGCVSTKYLVDTNRKLHLIANSSRISAHCSPEDKEDKNSFTYVVHRDDKRVNQFIFRRPWPYESCLYRKKEIQKIINGASRIEIMGTEGSLTQENEIEADDQGVSFKFPDSIEMKFWFFERIKNKKDCHSYFEHACKENPLDNIIE